MNILWQACLQGAADALERVCLLLGCASNWPACVQCCADTLERVFLLFGRHVFSAMRTHLSGCDSHFADCFLSVCVCVFAWVGGVFFFVRVCGVRVCACVGACAAPRGCTGTGTQESEPKHIARCSRAERSHCTNPAQDPTRVFL